MALVGTRLIAAAVLLVGLFLMEDVFDDAFPVLISIVLIGLPFLQWATVYFFGRRAKAKPDVLSLQIRVQDAFAMALASTAGAVLGILVVARAVNLIPPFDRSAFLVGLSFALLMGAAPAVNWLIQWRPWLPDPVEADE